MNPHEIAAKVDSLFSLHPMATLASIAGRIGISPAEVEQALRETEGVSFQEFRQTWRLREAFKLLGADRALPPGPWDKARSNPRRIIPRTTVRYRVRKFWPRNLSYSNPCPLVDLSSGGLGFLSDDAPVPGKRVSLLLKFPEKEKDLPVEGRVVYTVATGIAGYRHRVGVQFLHVVELQKT
jgi:AraC-like DNA-binding protein